MRQFSPAVALIKSQADLQNNSSCVDGAASKDDLSTWDGAKTGTSSFCSRKKSSIFTTGSPFIGFSSGSGSAFGTNLNRFMKTGKPSRSQVYLSMLETFSPSSLAERGRRGKTSLTRVAASPRSIARPCRCSGGGRRVSRPSVSHGHTRRSSGSWYRLIQFTCDGKLLVFSYNFTDFSSGLSSVHLGRPGDRY